MRKIIKHIFYNWLGWKIVGEFPQIDKAIVIVAPHTSNWDFPIGLFTRYIKNEKIKFVGKKELFRWPFGYYFKAVGGIALDRTPGQSKTDAFAKLFKQYDKLKIQIAPEGTRSSVKEWKTGFYWIAVKAEVPIIPIAFDYATKTVTVFDTFHPTGKIEKDLPHIKRYFEHAVGYKDL